MSSVFDNIASAAVIHQSSGSPFHPVADIFISGSGGAHTSNLPIIEITKLSHRARKQIDCTLDGTLHILSAHGGVTTCALTCLDRLPVSCGSSLPLDSALVKYRENLESYEQSQITVNIYSADSTHMLASFTGVFTGCSARATIQGGVPHVLVTYDMVGVWA